MLALPKSPQASPQIASPKASPQIIRSEIYDPLVKQQDVVLWQKWKNSKSQQDLEILFKRMDGVIYREVSRQSGSLPPVFLEVKAKEYAKQAFEKFDPNRGVQLSTHLVNYLRQLSRLNATFRQSARIPEYQQKFISDYKAKKNSLEESLGRIPTLEELADELQLNTKLVSSLERGLSSELSDAIEISHEAESKFSLADDVDPMVVFFYQGLSPQEKLLFEYTTGYGGKPKLNNPSLAKKLNLNYSQLSYQKRLLISKIKKVLHGGIGVSQ